MKTIEIKSINEIDKAAVEFIEHLNNSAQNNTSKCIAFYGHVGAGKTTFIKALCKQLGSNDNVTSPTFALINEYETKDVGLVYHFDFYRIDTPEEAYDFGYEDYFYSDSFCFIEWPERIEQLLPENHIKVKISEQEEGTRTMEIQSNSL